MINTPPQSAQFKARSCPKCGSTDTSRARRKAWEKWLSTFITIKAYRCIDCNTRFISSPKN